MKVSDFDFELPRELIATHPAEPRESARLLEIGALPANPAALLTGFSLRRDESCKTDRCSNSQRGDAGQAKQSVHGSLPFGNAMARDCQPYAEQAVRLLFSLRSDWGGPKASLQLSVRHPGIAGTHGRL